MSTLAREVADLPPRPTCSLNVWSNVDAEIELFDAQLEKLAHSVHTLTVPDLTGGLYKIRVIRGRDTVERLIDLRSDLQINLWTNPTYTVAPLWPVYGGDSTKIETFARRAIELAGRPGPDEGQVLLLSHRPDPRDRDPLSRLTLRSWGKRHDKAAADRSGGPIEARMADESWSAWSAHPQAGMWELQIGTGLRQVVPVIPGWQTRIFVRRVSTEPSALRKGGSGETRSRPRAVTTEISMQMAKPDADVVYIDHYESVEVARKALELERPIFAGTSLIDELLHNKWDNPLMGITGTHLLLAALERDDLEAKAGRPVALRETDRARAPELLKTVLANLEKLVGPYCRSDLAALHIRARSVVQIPVKISAIDAPPIYWSSWRALMRQERNPDHVEIPRFVWSRVSRARPIGPYFGWQPGRVSVDREVRDLLSKEANVAPPPIMTGPDHDAILGIGAESSRAPAISTADLARFLGAPPSLVDDSLSRLRGQLDPDWNEIIS